MSLQGNEPVDFLIVDDEKLIHSLVIRSLRSYGLKNLLSVYSANEALKILRNRKVNFVITDWIMPQMTGIELIQVIRNDPELFATPVVFLTGVCSAEGVVCAMEEGADGYLIKPFSPAKLMKSIISIKKAKADPLHASIIEMTRLKLQGRHHEAVRVGKEILEKRRDSKVLFMLGECLAKVKQYPAAVDALAESARSEKCGRSTNLLGKIYMEQGEQEKGLDHMRRASEQCSLTRQRRQVDLAEAYFKSGMTDEAEAVVDTILKSNPTNLILADIGKLYLDQGDVERAGSFLENGVVPTPETVHIFNNYAISLRRREMYKESEEIYRKCIELVPDSFALYFNAGMVYSKMGQFGQAIEMFENALRINPDYEPARVFLETVRSKMAQSSL